MFINMYIVTIYILIYHNYAKLNKIRGIAIASIPTTGIGIAINDRLKRAVSY